MGFILGCASPPFSLLLTLLAAAPQHRHPEGRALVPLVVSAEVRAVQQKWAAVVLAERIQAARVGVLRQLPL